MNFPLLPLLAIEVGEIIGIIFLVVSVLGWIVKVIKGEGNGAPKPVVRRNEAERVRTEIESFLEEIGSANVKRPPARENQQPRPAERPRPPMAKANKKPPKPLKPQQTAAPQKPTRSLTKLSDKHLTSSNLGEGLRSHVAGFLQPERIANEVRQDLAGVVPAKATAEVGRGGALSSVTTGTKPQMIHPLIALLRNQQGVQQAMALQEILQKPLALRNRK